MSTIWVASCKTLRTYRQNIRTLSKKDVRIDGKGFSNVSAEEDRGSSDEEGEYSNNWMEMLDRSENESITVALDNDESDGSNPTLRPPDRITFNNMNTSGYVEHNNVQFSSATDNEVIEISDDSSSSDDLYNIGSPPYMDDDVLLMQVSDLEEDFISPNKTLLEHACPATPLQDINNTPLISIPVSISVATSDDAAINNSASTSLDRVSLVGYMGSSHVPNEIIKTLSNSSACNENPAFNKNHDPMGTGWHNMDAVIVLDNLIVPDYMRRTMSLGCGFNFQATSDVDIKRSKIEELICISKLNIWHPNMKISHQSELDNGIRALIDDVLMKDRNLHGRGEMEWKRLISEDLALTKKFLKDNPEIIISKADKGGKVIASKRDTVTKLRDVHISENIDNGTYSVDIRSIKHIASELSAAWTLLLSSIQSDITSNTMGGMGIVVVSKLDLLKLLRLDLRAQDKEFSIARMWGQLKVHKPQLAYRPIVDNSVKLGEPLEKLILSTLNEILASKASFYQEGPLYKHMADCHNVLPTYPNKVKILSGKSEKGIFALNNRLAVELTVNPNLI